MQRVTQYQGEALGGGSPSLDCCKWPLLHHILGLLIHSHHRLFGYSQEPRDQLIFTLHLFLSDRKTSDSIYIGAKHLHRWFIQGANTKIVVPFCCWCFCNTHAAHVAWGPKWRRRGAAVNWPSRVQPCLTAALLNRVSTGFSHYQHTSMVLPPALCLTSSSGLHSLPTENLLQLTSEAEPTLGAPPGVQRTIQKLAVCRDGGVKICMFHVSGLLFFITRSKWRALRITQRPVSETASRFRALKHKDR